MPLPGDLLEILRCPQCKGQLAYFESESFLLCPECRLRYGVQDDIPDMLGEDAERLDADAAAALVDQARARGLL